MQLPLPSLTRVRLAVIGLGYVGLPLALQFAKTKKSISTGRPIDIRVVGYDLNTQRLDELKSGVDRTGEVRANDLEYLKDIEFTNNSALLANADVFLVTVPTPVDPSKRPDFTPLENACRAVGSAIKTRRESNPSTTPLVIFESTVFPGATEEICVPIIEQASGQIFNSDFFCGYSPERINPGDPERHLTSIVKVTSGSTTDCAQWVDSLYGAIIEAGTFQAPSIKVAEAAKVIENTQRDINIALVNELSIIFNKLGLDTLDVLETAATKWNFLHFKPGLVGGHCIGVDPYYLTYKAEQVGYHPEIVLAGRRINDSMASKFVEQIVLKLAKAQINIGLAHVLICGFTFKENCPDTRNTKVIDLIHAFSAFGVQVTIVDPHADPSEASEHYGIDVYSSLPSDTLFDSVVIAVAHDFFRQIDPLSWQSLLKHRGLLVDLKGILPRDLNAHRP